MSIFETYQLYYTTGYCPSNMQGKQGCEYKFLNDNFKKAVGITFRARNRKEAMKKADKIWREGQFGGGSITVKVV